MDATVIKSRATFWCLAALFFLLCRLLCVSYIDFLQVCDSGWFITARLCYIV